MLQSRTKHVWTGCSFMIVSLLKSHWKRTKITPLLTAPSLTQYVKCMFRRRGQITQTTMNEAQRPRKVPYMNQDWKKVYCRSTLYGSQFRLSPRQLIKPNILYYPPLMQHHSFFRNRYPIYTWRSCLNSFVRDSRVNASENHDLKRQIERQKKKHSIDYTAQEMLMKRENEWKDCEIVNILVIEYDWCR